MMNNLDKIPVTAKPLPRPTGSPTEQGLELIRRCDAREEKLAAEAIAAEREGDYDGTWMAMALRAENARFKARIQADIEPRTCARCKWSGLTMQLRDTPQWAIMDKSETTEGLGFCPQCDGDEWVNKG